MDYLHTYPNAVICYHASDMILKITSDAAYLVQPKAHSRAAVHYHVGWRKSDRTNGPVDVLCKTIKTWCPRQLKLKPVVSTLAESMPAHYKPTNNSTITQGILNSKMRQKLSKSFDMRYWWMKDRIKQGQFNLLWPPGKLNLANYFTKHHPPWHHPKMRHKYLQKVNSLQSKLPKMRHKCLHKVNSLRNKLPTSQWARVC
jgi:hypothetical protein